jgi:acyl carrier protein
MDYTSIHLTVNFIKSLLIYKQRNAASTNLPEEVMKVWENVKSPNFQMPVRSIVNQIENFRKIFNKDFKDFNNSLANKERTLKQLENDLIRMISSFTKSVGEIFPQDLLSYKEDNLLEESSSPRIVNKKEEIINKNTVFKKLNSWDSLFILELIMMIDEKYNIKIETDIILNSNTIEDLHKSIF